MDDEAEGLAAALAVICKEKGYRTELGVLAVSEPSLIKFDNGVSEGRDIGLYNLILQVPTRLYLAIEPSIEGLQERLEAIATPLRRLDEYRALWDIKIRVLLSADSEWRQGALDSLTGKGVNNQGRVRSDNVAPMEHRGLYFRSQPEIYLFEALVNKGIPFAPLAVFLRGDGTHGRIEPDFTLLFKGRMCLVEVDGAAYQNKESPVDAQDRVEFLLTAKAEVFRVPATDCNTSERAAACVDKIIAYFDSRV